ncbi:MAG: hypothetical protein ABJA78_14735 [Ferruginibacter sp.]
MKTIFWICWTGEMIIAAALVLLLVRLYTSGIIAQKSAADLLNYWLLLFGAIGLIASSRVFYHYGWYKTAALIAALPLLILLVILLIPLLAYFSGERMN